MARPGTEIVLRETPTVVSQATDTGVAFMAGLADRGPANQAHLIQNLQDFITVYGDRQSYSVLYDSAEMFFREGGSKVYIGRVVGPAATSGSHNLMDGAGTPAISLVCTAVGPGAWSAGYKVAVAAGVGSGTYKIQVTNTAGDILEDSGDLLDQNAAVLWSTGSDYIRITLGVSALNPAVVAGAALTAGTDDRTNITDDEWQTALDTFTVALGPGQVLAPGRVSLEGHTQLKDHAESHDRVALIDLTNTATVATLEGDADAINTRFGAAFAPWVIVPGVTGGSFRTIPPSPMIAGIIARNDPGLGANRAAAGIAGISRFAIDLSQPNWSDVQREALNNSGVNVIIRKFGSIRNYGWRSLTDPISDANWIDFGNARLFTAISAELDNVSENYLFIEIDGQFGDTIGSFHTALAGVMLSHFNNHELFGDTADQAFTVDTGPGVNTLARIANNELHAVVSMKMAAMAEWIQIEIVKLDITQAI